MTDKQVSSTETGSSASVSNDDSVSNAEPKTKRTLWSTRMLEWGSYLGLGVLLAFMLGFAKEGFIAVQLYSLFCVGAIIIDLWQYLRLRARKQRTVGVRPGPESM